MSVFHLFSYLKYFSLTSLKSLSITLIFTFRFHFECQYKLIISTLFVSGLPYTATEEKVKQVFSNFGSIRSIRMPHFQDTGRCRGYAIIQFSSSKEANDALDLDKAHFDGRFSIPPSPFPLCLEKERALSSQWVL